MATSKIAKIKDGRLILTKGQSFWHYSIILFLLISPIYTTIQVFQYYIPHTYHGTRTVQEMIFVGYIWVVPAVIFYFIQRHRLKFKVIELSISAKNFKAAIEESVKELEWKIEAANSYLLVAKSSFKWTSWGELITIIREEDRVLFNSICDPDSRPSVVSFGMNKLNRKVFQEKIVART